MLTILAQSLHNTFMERLLQKRIAVRDSWVAVDVYGDPSGPAIVVIPGAMANAEAWGHFARRLEGWPTVAVMNRRGRRPSGPLTDAYGFATELADASAVIRECGDVRALFGWSYGGLIALHLANSLPLPHLIAYEPIMAPFGASALLELSQLHAMRDADGSVETALQRVTGMNADEVASVRSDSQTWRYLRSLGSTIYPETLALNNAPKESELGALASRVDLIIGERNRGRPPYGTSFADVKRNSPRAILHQLSGAGHLAHVEDPDALATLVSELGAQARGSGVPGMSAQ